MKINKNVEVAIAMISILRVSTGVVKISTIANTLETGEAFVEQIARKLRLAGITRAVRGPGGGIYIPEGKKITALDVVKALGGKTSKFQEHTVTNDLYKAVTEAYNNFAV